MSRWDDGAVASPVVRRYLSDDGERWVMWYSGRPRGWKGAKGAPPGTLGGFAGLALSDDGVTWDRVKGPKDSEEVLGPNVEDWWTFDFSHLSVGDVSIDSNDKVRSDGGVYFLWYSGGDREEVTMPNSNGAAIAGLRSRIGVAMSKDGEHFARVEGEHPSGCVLDVGMPGAFDELFVAGPNVVRPAYSPLRKAAGANYLMHYHTFDAATDAFVIGCATSEDGLKFVRDGCTPVLTGSGKGSGRFDERGVSRCCLVERNSTTCAVLFVECVDAAGVHRIAMTESNDGRNWGELRVVLDAGEGLDAWDGAGVSHPNVVPLDDGSVRLYYVGKSATHDIDEGRGTCIGLAQSRGGDWTAFDRISI